MPEPRDAQAGHGWLCPQDKMESKIVCPLIANVILTILNAISNYRMRFNFRGV